MFATEEIARNCTQTLASILFIIIMQEVLARTMQDSYKDHARNV